MEENKPRVRLNVKTLSNGEKQPEVTIETFDIHEDPLIRASRIVIQLDELEKQLKLSGYKIAGENKK